MKLVPASQFSSSELAALFTASFQDYALPMLVDEPTFRRMHDLFDFDLDASRLALRDGRPIGLANLGIREREGWIGGMGVVPEERRKGVAEQLMHGMHDAARERGVERVTLEVIESNAPAIALYGKLGYEHVRELEVWRLDGPAVGRAGREVPPAEAHAQVQSLRTAPEPWQRADVVVERALATEPRRGFATDGGAAVVRTAEQGAVVEQIAARDVRAASELLRSALEAAHPVRLTNVPEDDPVAAAFRELGGRLELRQHELRLAL